MDLFDFELPSNEATNAPVGTELEPAQTVMGRIRSENAEAAKRGSLNRGAKKVRLINELARNEATVAELAERYEVTEATICNFKRKHNYIIEATRKRVNANVAQVMEHLWVVNKADRLAEYQQAVEDLEFIITKGLTTTGTIDAKLVRLKFDALKNIAEELGELPPRVAIQNNNTMVNYTLEGVDLDAL